MVVQKSSVRRRATRRSTPSPLTRAASPAQVTQEKKQRARAHARTRAAMNKYAAIKRSANLKKSYVLLAEQTVDVVLGDGKYTETRRCRDWSPLANAAGPSMSESTCLHHVVHDISRDIQYSVNNTVIFKPSSPISTPISRKTRRRRPAFEFTKGGVLTYVRRFAGPTPSKSERGPSSTGVLIPTSRRPGGDFTEGSGSVDASVARSTSLIAPLSFSPAGQDFFHNFDSQNMLYVPQVVGIRRDDRDELDLDEFGFKSEGDAQLQDVPKKKSTKRPVTGANGRALGEFVAPYAFNVLAVPRAPWSPLSPGSSRDALKSRLDRALSIFAARGDRDLVLCPDSAAPLGVTAQIYAELLACKGSSEEIDGRYRKVFDRVYFCVPRPRLQEFRSAFEMRVFEDELNASLSENESDSDVSGN